MYVFRVYSKNVTLAHGNKIYNNLRIDWFVTSDSPYYSCREEPLAPYHEAIENYELLDSGQQYEMEKILDEFFTKEEAETLRNCLDNTYGSQWENEIEAVSLPLKADTAGFWKEPSGFNEGYYILFEAGDPELPLDIWGPVQILGRYSVENLIPSSIISVI